MKKRSVFILAALILLMLGVQVFGAAVAADGSNDTDISLISSQNESDETSQSDESTLFEEPANKSFTWLYILIAVAAVVLVIAAIVFISKKK